MNHTEGMKQIFNDIHKMIEGRPMNYNPNVQPIRSALIVYLQGLEELYQGDLTIAYPVARVSTRRLLETLAISDAKEEPAQLVAERIIDLIKELKEVKS